MTVEEYWISRAKELRMTREEAKHIVDVAFSVPQAIRRAGEDRTYHQDEISEAKNMAIQALSQEPCDDAISRDAVDNYIAKLLSGYLYDEERERLEKLSAYLWELPSVTPKSGKWIRYKDNCLYNQCSYCGASHCREDNFCPNCGAKMESNAPYQKGGKE